MLEAGGAAHAALVMELLRGCGTGGNLVSDAQLAASALEHDATVASADSDFGRFPGVRWRNPLRHSLRQ